MTNTVADGTRAKVGQFAPIALVNTLLVYSSIPATQPRFRVNALVAAFLLMFTLSMGSFAAGDPVTNFITSIETTALGVCAVMAVLGIIVAGAAYMFGSGNAGEMAMKIGLGCFVLGGAGAIGSWLFGL